MLNANHPDDERLSALASGDDEATADGALLAHVTDCARCTDLVADLGRLRIALAELPDLRPARPLQLLPPAAAAPAARGSGGWIRRLFAPAMTAGAALALVGLVGTLGPTFSSGLTADSGAPAGGQEEQAAAADASSEVRAFQTDATDAPLGGLSGAGAEGAGGGREALASAPSETAAGVDDGDVLAGDEPAEPENGLPAERSPWPMVLFSGVAILVATLLLRWILVPRAG